MMYSDGTGTSVIEVAKMKVPHRDMDDLRCQTGNIVYYRWNSSWEYRDMRLHL